MRQPFEILDHTADIGLRACGETLSELFTNAALGLQSIALDINRVKPAASYPLSATGEDSEALLVNWLNEIIYFLDGERIAFSRFEVDEPTDRSITAQGWGGPRDSVKHPARLVVKAATYHQLTLARDTHGWTAEGCRSFVASFGSSPLNRARHAPTSRAISAGRPAHLDLPDQLRRSAHLSFRFCAILVPLFVRTRTLLRAVVRGDQVTRARRLIERSTGSNPSRTERPVG